MKKNLLLNLGFILTVAIFPSVRPMEGELIASEYMRPIDLELQNVSQNNEEQVPRHCPLKTKLALAGTLSFGVMCWVIKYMIEQAETASDMSIGVLA